MENVKEMKEMNYDCGDFYFRKNEMGTEIVWETDPYIYFGEIDFDINAADDPNFKEMDIDGDFNFEDWQRKQGEQAIEEIIACIVEKLLEFYDDEGEYSEVGEIEIYNIQNVPNSSYVREIINIGIDHTALVVWEK